MHPRRRQVLQLATAATLAGTGTARATSPSGTLVYAAGTDALSLDPQFVNDVPSERIVTAIYDTLVLQDSQGTIQPMLATSWKVSPDNLTWTFTLRQNVRFQDGTVFDANAVKVTFDRLRDPATRSPRRSDLSPLQDVRVVDPHIVQLVTKQPFAPLLPQLGAYTLSILSPAQITKAGPKLNVMPIGTGPFRLESWQPGEKAVLVRNDSYWGDRPKLDRVEWRVVPEDSTRALMLLSGQVDVIAAFPIVMLKRLQANKAVRVIRAKGYRTILVGMNTKMPPFTDIRVRQAVAHAIDKEAIVGGVLGGIGTLGGALESTALFGSDSGLPPYPHHPGRSRALLAEAGFPQGIDVDFYVPIGRYIMDRQVGEAIQGQFAEAGIRARIQSPEFGTFTSLLMGRKMGLFLTGKGSPSGDMDLTETEAVGTGGSFNYFNISDPEIDRVLAAQRSEMDRDKRAALLKRLSDLVYDQYVAVVLYYEDQLFATRANVHDMVVYPDEVISFAKTWIS